jgi:hypothetical protein
MVALLLIQAEVAEVAGHRSKAKVVEGGGHRSKVKVVEGAGQCLMAMAAAEVG